MSDDTIRIAGVGCALADFLYTKVDFKSPGFSKYISVNSGDGGLSPGKLVFTEELQKFANKPYSEILKDIIGENTFDNFNIGGPALVSLIHAAQILPRDEFETSFYGCTGDDITGELITDLVKKTPLNISNYIKVKDGVTAFTDVLSDSTYDNGNGERTFINNIGASWNYNSEMLSASFFDADIVCFGGTALVPRIHDELTNLLKKAKSNNCITVVNTVYDFRNEKRQPNSCWPLGNNCESFKLIDLLVMDCEESLKISGKKSIQEAAEYFKQENLSSFVITNGSKDVYAYSNGTLFARLDLKQFPVSEKIVSKLKDENKPKGDTTGCGDNFVGGLIASIALQLKQKPIGRFNLPESLSWGISSGGFTCFYAGGTFIEKNAGEKISSLLPYQESYLKQIDLK